MRTVKAAPADMLPIFLFMWLLIVFVCMPSHPSFSYLMPPEQVLELMSENFSTFDTLKIVQWAKVTDPENEGSSELMEQDVWIKSPWRLRCTETEQSQNQRNEKSGRAKCGWCNIARFESMFVKHSASELLNFLGAFGVDVSKVSLTHVGARIAYIIGRKRRMNSYIVISRDEFLPIMFRVGRRALITGPFVVRFEDYKRVEKGWYPFRIICEADLGQKEQYVIQDIEPNVDIDSSVFQPTQGYPVERSPENTSEAPVDERIKDVINTIKEKYQ